MDKEIKILILEDNPADAELEVNILKEAGMKFSWQRVETGLDFEKALDEFSPNIILADYKLPAFDAPAALKIVLKKCPYVPFIIVTGSVGDVVAVDALKNGATDYILKDNLQKLPSAVERALAQVHEQLRRKEVEASLKASEERYRTLVQSANSAIIRWKRDGSIIFFNEYALKFFGYTFDEIIDKHIGILLPHKETTGRDLSAMVQEIAEYPDNYINNLNENICKDGRRAWMMWTNKAKYDEKGQVIEILAIGSDVTESKKQEMRERLLLKILGVLNKSDPAVDAICSVMKFIKQDMGFEAVGIRIREGEDFPYYVANGFSEDFLAKERFLCQRDDKGDIVRNTQGIAFLECMCGNIISGRTDSRLPFFTEGGSFWTNSTTDLLASTTEKERQARTRNRCNAEGYESVALIPLRSEDKIEGLLQFNDHRRNMFTPAMIKFFEELGVSIGIAFSRKKNRDRIQHAAEEWRATFDSIPDLISIVDKYFKIVKVNKAFAGIFGLEPQEAIGKPCYELVHGGKEPHPDCPYKKVQLSKTAETVEFLDNYLKKYLEVTVAPLFDDQGDSKGAVHIVRDITVRKKLEEEGQKHLHELEVFYKASIGREGRILQLKKQVKELEEEAKKK